MARLNRFNGTCLAALAAASLSGCGYFFKERLSEMAEAFTSASGIPVQVLTDDSDVCATKFARSLGAEYSASTKARQVAIRTQFGERYRSIIIWPTTITQVRTSEVLSLEFIPANRRDTEDFPDAKTVGNNVETRGSSPQNRFQGESDLVLRPEAARNTIHTVRFGTSNRSVFAHVNDIQQLEEAIASRKITKISQEKQLVLDCAPALSIVEAFQSPKAAGSEETLPSK